MTWLLLKDAAKKTRLAKGWLYWMTQRGVLPSRVNEFNQIEVRLWDISEHLDDWRALKTPKEKLLTLIGNEWIKYKGIRQALPGVPTLELTNALQLLLLDDRIEVQSYTNHGKCGREYRRMTNDTSDQ